MRLLILSGRSGSGKSTALDVLEDAGFNCIDNLPASLLPALTQQFIKAKKDDDPITDLAVSIDARNPASDLQQFQDVYQQLQDQNIPTAIFYLDARDTILVQRFSETRRKHPLSNQDIDLREAINIEKERLSPIRDLADLSIDTSQMTLHELRDVVKAQIAIYRKGGMAVQVQSFGFKRGVPVDADFVFDVRCLPNPYWVPELRAFTGQDPAIVEFLEGHDEVVAMADDIQQYLIKWLPQFKANNRSYVTIAIGCTGGQHRSVFISERLQRALAKHYDNAQVRHRELSR